ncbi:MAG: TraR/DksA C4-type zinc finger protein [Pseudomonadota bacterium]
MDAVTIAEFDRLIRDRLAELEVEELATSDDRKPVELDQQSVGRLSRMDALQVQAMATAQSRRRAAERSRLTTALKRIGEDDYGWCDDCGDEIGEGRLRIDLAATRCVDCAGA